MDKPISLTAIVPFYNEEKLLKIRLTGLLVQVFLIK